MVLFVWSRGVKSQWKAWAKMILGTGFKTVHTASWIKKILYLFQQAIVYSPLHMKQQEKVYSVQIYILGWGGRSYEAWLTVWRSSVVIRFSHKLFTFQYQNLCKTHREMQRVTIYGRNILISADSNVNIQAFFLFSW